MKTAVSVPNDVFRAAERTAKRLGISRSELYARAIAKFMSEEAQVTAALDRVYANDAGKLDPTLGELQRRAHKRVEW
jgi:predicted transcriptional regulator